MVSVPGTTSRSAPAIVIPAVKTRNQSLNEGWCRDRGGSNRYGLVPSGSNITLQNFSKDTVRP